MTPLYCPRCRRPVSGELEHGVCPLPDRPVEVAPHVWSVYRSKPQEDFGEPLTPRRLSWAVWRARIWNWILWAGVSALVALVALSALMVRQYGRLLP